MVCPHLLSPRWVVYLWHYQFLNQPHSHYLWPIIPLYTKISLNLWLHRSQMTIRGRRRWWWYMASYLQSKCSVGQGGPQCRNSQSVQAMPFWQTKYQRCPIHLHGYIVDPTVHSIYMGADPGGMWTILAGGVCVATQIDHEVAPLEMHTMHTTRKG